MADRTEWQWRDTGSGPGALQRVRVTPETSHVGRYVLMALGSSLAAHRELLDHLSTCPDCQDVTGCLEAQRLRRVYRELRP